MKIILLVLIFLFVFTTPIYATRSIIISADKNSLNAEEEALINASSSGFATDEAVFIKGAFFKEGSTNYFGLTNSNGIWIKNSENAGSQLQVKLNDWDGFLKIKSDTSDSGFIGSGDYKFKVGFYFKTSSGNLSSVNWSTNILDFNLKAPTPSPSPNPTNPPTSSPTNPPQIARTPTVTHSPSPISTPVKLSTPNSSNTPENTKSEELIDTLGIKDVERVLDVNNVLGIETSSSQSPQPKKTPITTNGKKNVNLIPFSLIGSGILLIGISIYYAFKNTLP